MVNYELEEEKDFEEEESEDEILTEED